jgi:adenosylhomocysteinase
MGARVIVTEIEPVRALEAVMDGFQVMPMQDASTQGDIFITMTGNIHAIDRHHLSMMKDGAIIANSGHFNVEINIPALETMAQKRRSLRPFVEEFTMEDGRRLYLLGEGRLINLAAAEGHPSSVMDMSFANQLLSATYLIQESSTLAHDVHMVPKELDEEVGRLKLHSMGIAIDALTEEQNRYINSWESGT